MTVNNKQLIDLLTQKTGLEPGEAEQQVHQLVKYVGNQVDEEGSCTIDGLGTFGLQDGELHFEADDLLTLEINHKYAGMKPIELIGAYKDIGETPVPVTETGSDLPEPETKVEDQKEPEITEAELEKEETPVTEEQEELDIPDEISADTTPESEEISAPEENEIEFESEPEEPVKEPVLKKEPAGKAEKTITPASKPEDDKWKPRSKPKTMRSRKSKSSDAFGKWLVAAVIVIAIGIAGWLVYDMGLNGGAEDTGTATNTITENSSGQGMGAETDSDESSSDEDVAAADLSGGPDTGQEQEGAEEESLQDTSEPDAGNSTSNVTDIAEESRQSAYGLRGGATPDVKDGYTIVVHSLRDEAKVRRVNSELQQQGYRTVIFSANVMDTTFWRLGLGQFKTIEDALEAAATLPDTYKQNHFVRRIQ